MKPRKATMGLAAVVLLALASAQAHARAGAVCKTRNGDVIHTGTDGSFCEAVADGTSKSKAKAKGKSVTAATSGRHGTAKAIAIGGSNAQSVAFGKGKAKAKAIGGSVAFAECGTNGTFAQAMATGGGVAKAFDNATPTCTPGAGTAKVRSSGGNCG